MRMFKSAVSDMNIKHESQLSALAESGLVRVSNSWMESRLFGIPVVSFWPLQISGWGLALMFPLFIWLSGTATEPNLLWLTFSRPFSGLMVTASLRPFCSRIFHRGAGPYLLIPAILVAAVAIGWTELNVACWLLRINGLPDLPGHIWVGILVHRSLTLLVWLLLYFGIKSFVSHSEIEREFQRSEIRLLRSQVNPHFLFNALTTIMAVRKDEQQVALITQSLADYLRFSLSQQEEDRLSHPLEEELEALENYLQVEKIRFQKNFESRIEATPEARAAGVPPALVQPLLENAIKYGQQTSPLPLRVAITARVAEGKLHLTVENTGRWVEPGLTRSPGIGIANLRKRLHLLYGDRAQVSFDFAGAAVKAQVFLPIQSPA